MRSVSIRYYDECFYKVYGCTSLNGVISATSPHRLLLGVSSLMAYLQQLFFRTLLLTTGTSISTQAPLAPKRHPDILNTVLSQPGWAHGRTGSHRKQTSMASVSCRIDASTIYHPLWPLFEASKAYFPLAPLVLRHFGQPTILGKHGRENQFELLGSGDQSDSVRLDYTLSSFE